MPILVINDRQGRQVYEVTEERVYLGRSGENHVVIDDLKSSRRHCSIENTKSGYMLEDLNSLNGTLVNGSFVSKHRLKFGDIVQIGEATILFESSEAKADLAPALRKEQEFKARTEPAIETMPEPAPGEAAERASEENLKTRKIQMKSPVELQQENKILRKMLEINRALSSELDVHSLLEKILDSAIEITSAERGFLILLEGGEMRFEVARGADKVNIENPEVQISHHITSEVISSRHSVISADAQMDGRFSDSRSVRNLQLRSVLCTPLAGREGLIGAIYIDNAYEEAIFAQDDIALMEAFSSQAAITIENARLLDENKKKHEEIRESYRRIEALNRELENKVVRQTRELLSVKEELEESVSHLKLKYRYDSIIGRGAKMMEILKLLDRITDVNVPVLIEGESGTGKELIAKAIHFNGPRKDRPFVSENCAAISETLLESELFGYMKGAFTGAEKNKKGLFEVANGGTLFLDEIGDMSSDMQKKLLRVLQEGEIRPVGGKETKKVDVRILSATNQRLTDLIEKGRFREDLFYRLNVVNIIVPPLRDRREDIPELITYFMTAIQAQTGRKIDRITKEAIKLLIEYAWPGNVRELENELKKMVALGGPVLDVSALSANIIKSGEPKSDAADLDGSSLKEMVEKVEKETIVKILQTTMWNKTKAARLLGLSRLGLRKKIERYGLDVT